MTSVAYCERNGAATVVCTLAQSIESSIFGCSPGDNWAIAD